MRAPQISVDQQMNRILISPKSVTVGVGGPSQGTVGATRLGLGQELQSQWALAVALHTWMDRGASTRCRQHSLYKREWILQANYALFHGWKESKEV